MTEEDFFLEAFRHLLDELEPAERAAFEAQLARVPAAAGEFKRCADGLARFAGEAAPAEPMTPAAQRVALAAILHAAGGATRAGGAARRGAKWAPWRWPAAALVLLGLNGWQWAHSPSPSNGDRRGSRVTLAAETDGRNREAARHGEIRGTQAEGSATIGALPSGSRLAPAEEARRLEKLRADYAALKRASDALRSEYDGILRELAQRTLSGQGVGRIAAMELVDSASYARGERKGLVNLARGLLTTPGIVAAGPVTPPPDAAREPTLPAPTVGADAGAVGTAVGSVSTSGAADPNVTGSATISPVPATPGLDAEASAPTPTLPATPETVTGGSTDPAYAWSVFDETEGQGYLNLYNLPPATAGQSLQLWVKSSGSADYQAVGEVPAQFYGGSGSLYYKLADATATPTEILITREPKNAPATQPTGPTVLRGP